MKIAQRIQNDRMRVAVLGGAAKNSIGIDPESEEFFDTVSSLVIQGLGVEINEKNDGPDSSRWVGELNGVSIYFEYDDMIGTTICVDLLASGSSKVVDNLVGLLNTF
ncbi:hypothetical protein [Holophaga foetida]|uniref:hypothetical protein n=1 Tax=Holophaga foetida TaxID=35839 RepID=UPI0011DD614C|nr:hypothetical protein [Holophaga foetida]